MTLQEAREGMAVVRIVDGKLGVIRRISNKTGKIQVRIGDNISAQYYPPEKWSPNQGQKETPI